MNANRLQRIEQISLKIAKLQAELDYLKKLEELDSQVIQEHSKAECNETIEE